MRNTKTIKISYDDLLAVLGEWDKYTQVLLNEMPKEGFQITFIDDGHGMGDWYAIKKNLSDFAGVLWKSLRSGANSVEEIHSLEFVETQVKYFKSHCVENNLESKLHSYRDPLNWDFWKKPVWDDPENPVAIFAKLGRAAQLQIVNEGLLDLAMSHFDDKKRVINEVNHKAEREQYERAAAHRERAAVQRKARVLDNSQCVFCGRDYRYASFDYYSQAVEFEPETVFLACNGCLKKREIKGLVPKFGRFSVSEK